MKKAKSTLSSVLLVCLSLIWLSPIYIILANSFKSRDEMYVNPLGMPAKFSLEYYSGAMEKMNFLRAFGVSLVITIVSVAIIVVLCAMAAWMMARSDGKLSKAIYYTLILTMLIPFQTLMMPLMQEMNSLEKLLGFQIKDTIGGLIFMYIGFGAGMGVFMFYGFVKGSLPRTLEEAAIIDGCNTWQLFWRVVFPLMKPTIWCDVGNWYDGKFMINDVTGPDEYTCIVNNNYYTNACAKYNLNWAVKAANILRKMDAFHALADKLALRDEELDEFQRAADTMYLPYNEKLGINPQDDSFLQKPIWDLKNTPKENFPLLLHYHPLVLYRHQVCKQADTVLAYYLFDGLEDRETVARSFAYYEPITTHDSSLSTCIFSIVASSLGEKEKAWNYFGSSITLDLQNKHGNTGDGIHTANMGGSYMVIVNGFAGVRIQEDGLHMAPYLPAAWSGYRFQMQYRGSSLELSVHKTGYCISLLNDVPVTILLPGTSIVLDRKASEYVHAWQEG